MTPQDRLTPALLRATSDPGGGVTHPDPSTQEERVLTDPGYGHGSRIADFNLVDPPRQRFWSRSWRVLALASLLLAGLVLAVGSARADDTPAQQEAIPGVGGVQGGDRALGGPVGQITPEDTHADARFSPASRSPRQAVADLAERYFPPEMVGTAVSVAWCESSFKPGADTNPPYIGLYQIDPAIHTWRVLAIYGRWRSLYDPEVNTAVAAHIVAELGWQPWPVCRYAQGGW